MYRKCFRLIIDFEFLKPYGEQLKALKCPQSYSDYNCMKLLKFQIELLKFHVRAGAVRYLTFVKLTTN